MAKNKQPTQAQLDTALDRALKAVRKRRSPTIAYDEEQRVEQHQVGPLLINVIRQDLHPRSPLPAHGKAKALDVLLESLRVEGYKSVGCFCPKYSTWPLALGPLCAKYDMRAHIVFPANKMDALPLGYLRLQVDWARYVTLHLIRPNVLGVNTNQANKILANKDAYNLPFGVLAPLPLSVLTERFESLFVHHSIGTLLACSGSAMSLVSMLRAANNMSVHMERVYSVSSGRSVGALRDVINTYAKGAARQVVQDPNWENSIRFIDGYKYADAFEYPDMWDIHPNYEGKLVHWLLSKIDTASPALLRDMFPEPIYLLNMGGAPK